MTANQSIESVFTPAGLLALLARRRILIAFSFLAVFGAVAAYVFTSPDRYQAELQLMVRRARTDAPVDAQRGAVTPVAPAVSDAEISSEIALFWNRVSLEEVVRRCGLVEEIEAYPDNPRAREAMAVRALQERLSVSRLENTNLISVRYWHYDAERAATVAKAVVDVYLNKHMAVHSSGDTSQFFGEQSSIYQAQLSEAQQALTDFRRRHQVSLLDAEKTAKMNRQVELQRVLQDTEAQIREGEDRVLHLRRQIAGLPETIETQSRVARNESLLDQLKTKLLELENRRTELLTKYDPGYRLVREVDQQIRDTRAMITREERATVVDRTQAVNPLRQTLEAELLRTENTLTGLRAKRVNVARDLGESQGEALQLERITGEHDDLVRRVKLAEENFLRYQTKLEETRLADAMDEQRILNVSIVAQAAPPPVPVERHASLLLLLGAILAGCGSLGLAFVTDAILLWRKSDAAETPGEELVKRPDYSVQDATADGGRDGRESRTDLGEPVEEAPVAAGQLVPARELPLKQDPASFPIPEDYPAFPGAFRGGSSGAPQGALVRMMASDIMLRDEFGHVVDYLGSLRGKGSGLAVGFGPAVDSEDAAIAAVRLAVSMNRRNGLPVLLVDAHRGARSLCTLFGTPESPGLRELLAGPDGLENQCIHRTSFDGLWLMPLGNLQPGGDAPLAKVATVQRALANRNMNLIVYLPERRNGAATRMLYSVLDAVFSSLEGIADPRDAEELVRRIGEAKTDFAERRPTLVGCADDWNDKDKNDLTMC